MALIVANVKLKFTCTTHGTVYMWLVSVVSNSAAVNVVRNSIAENELVKMI